MPPVVRCLRQLRLRGRQGETGSAAVARLSGKSRRRVSRIGVSGGPGSGGCPVSDCSARLRRRARRDGLLQRQDRATNGICRHRRRGGGFDLPHGCATVRRSPGAVRFVGLRPANDDGAHRGRLAARDSWSGGQHAGPGDGRAQLGFVDSRLAQRALAVRGNPLSRRRHLRLRLADGLHVDGAV